MGKRKKTTFRPGELVENSGIYAEIYSAGRKTGRQITAVEGSPFPPTSGKGKKWKAIKLTKHEK